MFSGGIYSSRDAGFKDGMPRKMRKCCPYLHLSIEGHTEGPVPEMGSDACIHDASGLVDGEMGVTSPSLTSQSPVLFDVHFQKSAFFAARLRP